MKANARRILQRQRNLAAQSLVNLVVVVLLVFSPFELPLENIESGTFESVTVL